MDAGGSSSRTDALGKLLPKALSEKRRRRKQQKQPERTDSLKTLSSDGTSVSNMADEDGDDMSINDGRSFGSFESGPEPDAVIRGSAPQQPKKSSRASSKNPSRATSQSPSRPGPGSQHPSLLGYLTTSSPAIQATHIDPGAQSLSPSQAGQPQRSPRISVTNAAEPPADLPSIGPPSAAKVASPSGRSRLSKDLASKDVPSTPPQISDSNAPSIVNTPPSPTNLPTSKASTWRFPGSTADVSPQSRALNSHKRASSASATLGPSKLSSVLTNPLTPPAEGNEGNQSSFFSSMISAAQSAANNLSTNLQNTNLALSANKGRATPTKPQTPNSQQQQQPTETETEVPTTQDTDDMDQKDSTARTIGTGDLSFSALGLEEPTVASASPLAARFNDPDNTRSRSESAPADAQISSNGEFIPEGVESRPRSLHEPPQLDVHPARELDDKHDMSRTGSLRRAHRKRGSSVTTTNTGLNVGAPLSGVTSPVPQPAANQSTPKLSGFAIASKKRNRDFHTIFKSVPDDDYLIEDYSCALQREILAHGRLYVSEGYLCFSSNILGWTTTVVVSFDEIVSVEKKSTALVFKNGLMISTLHNKHNFASFTSRDATYDLIVNIWKLGHPTLTSTLNGVRLEGTGGDKTEKLDGAAPSITGTDEQNDSGSEVDSDEDDEEFYDEEDGEDGEADEADDSPVRSETEKAVTRKISQMTTTNGAAPAQGKDGAAPAGAVDFPGPTTHAPTECGDVATHYDKVVGDDVVPAPLGRVFGLLFGKDSAQFMTNFLGNDQKCTEVTFDDKKGITLENQTRGYTYIKPLNNAIGPRQTKCVITEQLDNLDFEKAVNMTLTTQTPDVPSGHVFAIKTKYCLSWAPNNGTRIQVNCTIEWTGKSWIKGPIEKASNDGQAEHCKSLFVFIKNAVSSRQRAGTNGTNGGAKSKKKGKKGRAMSSAPNAAQKAPVKPTPHWGLLEGVRPVLEPVTDVFKPLFTGNVMYGLLVGLLVSSWFGFGWAPGRNAGPYGPGGVVTGPDRLAAYEEMWRREDSELWEWLEERIGLDRLNAEGGNVCKKALSPRTAEEKLRAERMDVKEVEEAMRVTEEKLNILKDVMGKSSKSPEAAVSGTGGV